MTLQNPFAQPSIILVQRQIPVFCLFQYRRVAAERRFGIDKVGGAERGSASLALITVCMLVVAVRASAGDVTVGEELMCLLVVILLGRFLNELSVFVQVFEVLGGGFVMRGVRGAGVYIKRDAEFLE